MPKIVDKAQKRRDIALACQDLFYEVGIKKLTIAQVAKTAGIGKGTVYEYFENKDDIVYELININIEMYHEYFLDAIKDINTTREKVFQFYQFVLDESEETKKDFNIYKEYLSIVLADENHEMMRFNGSCHIFFKEQLHKIINEGIKNNELIPQAINFVEALVHFEKGIACARMTEIGLDTKRECELFVNNMFDLLEVKK